MALETKRINDVNADWAIKEAQMKKLPVRTSAIRQNS